ncbi:hypothetical protein [Leptolyngbya sp. FACHB-711]|uniref:hypothetical protein n=1 Tax=Leptolyngbya sp. FACHB-711 TaxID=2692813 RepID=UPI001686C633|nr:hypothetical protein [Leptolyngbya sp. FACHB-711]MBD2028129.1 hypothetical protein [Leptolyngbya sp. FACHB-711]
MKFEVDAVDGSGRIVGRNIGEDIPIGSTFTRITKTQFEGQSPHITSTDSGIIASIRLTLKKVEWYGRSIDVIPGGHSAGLLVDGDGMSILNSVLENRKQRESVYLVVQ